MYGWIACQLKKPVAYRKVRTEGEIASRKKDSGTEPGLKRFVWENKERTDAC